MSKYSRMDEDAIFLAAAQETNRYMGGKHKAKRLSHALHDAADPGDGKFKQGNYRYKVETGTVQKRKAFDPLDKAQYIKHQKHAFGGAAAAVGGVGVVALALNKKTRGAGVGLAAVGAGYGIKHALKQSSIRSKYPYKQVGLFTPPAAAYHRDHIGRPREVMQQAIRDQERKADLAARQARANKR